MTSNLVVGMDEVGRGCWAGPLVAGAVILPAKLPESLSNLRDSKKILKPEREALALEINNVALAIGLGWVSSDEIDRLGLTNATSLAMRRAVAEITLGIDHIIIDGNINYLNGMCVCTIKKCTGGKCQNIQTIVKADDKVPAVSAAAIAAKVARDKWMANQAHIKYPNYGFDKHVGYGAPVHRAALQVHGICELHRKSYAPIKALLEVVS